MPCFSNYITAHFSLNIFIRCPNGQILLFQAEGMCFHPRKATFQQLCLVFCREMGYPIPEPKGSILAYLKEHEMFYFDWTYLLMIPGLLLGMWAQAKVKNAYAEYSRVQSLRGVSAAEAARILLNSRGNTRVSVDRVSGSLTDHYDPKSETLRLSEGVYASSSLAALGIAAHEAGHAMQKFENYAPMKWRSLMVPVVNIGSQAYFPLFLLGILFSWQPLITLGIIAFSLSLVFALVTLPVEFDASRRGVRMLMESGLITAREEDGVRKVLSAAALTYVAAAVTSLLQLLRLILISRRHDD